MAERARQQWQRAVRRTLLALSGVLLVQLPAAAQTPGTLPLLVGSGSAGTSYSVPIQTLLF
ncbi:MAG: flagellar biosynthetic protein FliP, partial [Burkholderiaceae bacterium]